MLKAKFEIDLYTKWKNRKSASPFKEKKNFFLMLHNFFREFSKYPLILLISTLAIYYYKNKRLF